MYRYWARSLPLVYFQAALQKPLGEQLTIKDLDPISTPTVLFDKHFTELDQTRIK